MTVSAGRDDAVILGSAIYQIDMAIRACIESGHSDCLKALARAIARYHKLRFGNTPNDLPEEIWAPEAPKLSRRIFAISILRILAHSNLLLQDTSIAIAIYKLLDDTLDDVYRQARVDRKEQNYSKLAKLTTFVKKVEDHVRQAAGAPSLSALDQFRREYLAALGRTDVRTLIMPFMTLPGGLDGLSAVFNSLVEYAGAPPASKLTTYQEARDEIAQSLRRMQPPRPDYLQQFVAEPLEQLLTLLDDDFRAQPINQPAAPAIEELSRKYPLDRHGAQFSLRFRLKNTGEGVAQSVELSGLQSAILKAQEETIYVGSLAPGEAITLEIPVTLIVPAVSGRMQMVLAWRNYDGAVQHLPVELTFEGQRGNVDWPALSRTDPYSLEPVTAERDLVGRTDMLRQLESKLCSARVGSFVVWGQKRVGKTSLVRTLESRLKQQEGMVVIYLEAGDYVGMDAPDTLDRLTKSLRSYLRHEVGKRISSGNLTLSEESDLVGMFREYSALCPGSRVVVILDEFDELPLELFEKSSASDALFLALRTLSGKGWLGFVLVGGERIPFIMNAHGATLNKFQLLRMDYFSRSEEWFDFTQLVRRPVQGVLEVEDDAVERIYDYTAGNPFFTKLVCDRMFQQALRSRDAYIGIDEIESAVKYVAGDTAANRFQHFWDDGVLEAGEKRERKIVWRKRLLVSLGEALREDSSPDKQTMIARAVRFGVPESMADAELREFVRRKVLHEHGESVRAVIGLFELWLRDRGVGEIVVTLDESDRLRQWEEEQEKLRVRSDEVVQLTEAWGPYQGAKITEDRVRSWLLQFGELRNQRLMFQILRGVRFYTGGLMRQKLAEAHGIVNRELARRNVARPGSGKRSDILVSYLDGPGKSGSYCARLYADENRIFASQVIEQASLARSLRANDCHAVVFVDDLVATGKSATEYIDAVWRQIDDYVIEHDLPLFFIAICGTQKGLDGVQRHCQKRGIRLVVNACDVIDDSARCFSPSSSVYSDAADRERAKRLAIEMGSLLERKHPLGYGESELAVVFEHNCPNNTLPILWKRSATWIPLFERK